jgi:hypothetical protein
MSGHGRIYPELERNMSALTIQCVLVWIRDSSGVSRPVYYIRTVDAIADIIGRE